MSSTWYLDFYTDVEYSTYGFLVAKATLEIAGRSQYVGCALK